VNEAYVVEFEHPRFGSARVFFRWRATKCQSFRWIPVAVEFDLFTPESEVAGLTEALESLRVDRSISVSALEFDDGGLPW